MSINIITYSYYSIFSKIINKNDYIIIVNELVLILMSLINFLMKLYKKLSILKVFKNIYLTFY